MRKLLFIAFIFLLAGCAKQQKEEGKTDKATGTEVADFEKLLNELSIADEKSVGKALDFFHERFSKDNKQAGDAAYVAFSKFHGKVRDTLTSRVMEDQDFQTIMYEEKEQKPAGKARAKELAGYGFKPETSEGMTYLIQDPDFLKQHFDEYVSPAMKEYLNISKKELDQLWTSDGGIIIPFTEVGERAVAWEKFNQQYPDFVLATETRDSYKSYMYYFLIGMDNTPAFGFEDKKLSDDFKQAFEYIRNTYPDTETGKTVSQYYQMLSSSGFKRTAQSDALVSKYAVTPDMKL